jgi:hypothetical protein
MQLVPLPDGIIAVCLVHGATIVPDDEIALPPAVAILILLPRGMRGQFVEEAVALVALKAHDPLHALGVQIKGTATGLRVRTNEG